VLGDGGHVVSILKPAEAGKMESLAQTLGFKFTDIDTNFDWIPRAEDGSVDSKADVDSLRRHLEDTLTLVNLAEDPVIDIERVESQRGNFDESATEEDEEDEDDDYNDEDDGDDAYR